MIDHNSPFCYNFGIVINKEIQMSKAQNYGMFSDYGNQVIDGLVIAAKEIGWTADQVAEFMEDISTVRGLHEANDTVVRENVFKAIFS
jgi:hypothetical protein